MIFSDSRYATGTILRANDSRTGLYPLTVFREYPFEQSGYFHYTWVERDRVDIVSNEFLGGPEFWWVIMDFNPEIIDPFDIPVGTVLRIPNVQ